VGPPIDPELAPAGAARRVPRWGLGDVVVGFLVGFLLATFGVSTWVAATHVALVHGQPRSNLGSVLVSLGGLWIGLAGVTVAASRYKGQGRLALDFGLALRPWPDLPLGVAVGVAGQFLVTGLYLPAGHLVSHLQQRLSQPGQQLTSTAHGAWLVLLAAFVVVGSPVVEELFFRGLLLRSLERRLAPLGRRLGPAVSIGISAIAFGLAHNEALQFFGLAVFGVLLGVLATWTQRLGPGIAAHAAFNAVAVAFLAQVH
jgi:membrane protease YdiL (CAAX protease family)